MKRFLYIIGFGVFLLSAFLLGRWAGQTTQEETVIEKPAAVIEQEVADTFKIDGQDIEIIYEEPLPEDLIEDHPTPQKEQWEQNAIPAPHIDGKALIVLVIDDMGVAKKYSQDIIDLPGPLTLSYLPYAKNLPWQTKLATKAGHELMVHVPMKPHGDHDPGPNVLDPALDDAEILRRLQWDLEQFDHYVGINNHMGSQFTESKHGMAVVLKEIKNRGLFFLDSGTTPKTVTHLVAQDVGVTHLTRDVFLDHVDDEKFIQRQIQRMENIARKKGYVITIAHPRPKTVKLLRQWLYDYDKTQFTLVPISTLLRQKESK